MPGPLLWGPLSESYGRRPIFIISFIVYTGFQVGCALSKNTASILIFRFLGGCFAAAPLTNSGGVLADIWDTDHRGQAMSIFSLAPFAGPSIGPIVAGFISVSGTVGCSVSCAWAVLTKVLAMGVLDPDHLCGCLSLHHRLYRSRNLYANVACAQSQAVA